MTERELGHTQGDERPASVFIKRLVGPAVLAVALAIMLIVLYNILRSPSLAVQLARAGLGRLPDSTINVKFVVWGGLFGPEATFIRFDAEPNDIQAFILESAISLLPREVDSRTPGIRSSFPGESPSWWRPSQSASYMTADIFILSPQGRYRGGVVVDSATGTVYVILRNRSGPSWLSWLRRKLPFL